MKAVVQHQFGETPRFATFEDPCPADGEVIVRVQAAVIRPADLAIAKGFHPRMPLQLPYVCGRDGVGWLEDGRRVYFRTSRSPFGAMAEYAPAEWVAPLPDDVGSAVAAALVGPALTAWLPLATRADIEPGETVLVLGASGVVGRLAVQAARLQGAARVVAASRRPETLSSLGADALIDLGQPPSVLQHTFATYAEGGIDVVIDFVWGDTLELLLAALVQGDGVPASVFDRGIRVVTAVDRGAGSLMLAPGALRDSRVQLMGCGPANHPPGGYLKTLADDILACASDGDLTMDFELESMINVADVWCRASKQDTRIVLTLD
ncbi:MAG: zinc-binding dehydrogenase [Cupriavidus sp.]|nr:zinc-binding dehydrogenase [Cupriavidus sp.]